MKTRQPTLLPMLFMGTAAMGVFIYLVGIGLTKFYFESVGTLILSPIIYVRILPEPFDGWLLKSFVQYPMLQLLVSAVPVAILGAATISGAISLWLQSTWLAFVSMFAIASVFVCYHFLQPFGVTLVTLF